MIGQSLFWASAHRIFHYRKPTRRWEIFAFLFGGIFALTWGFALVTNWDANVPNLGNGALVVGLPTLLGFALRKIRLVQMQGGDALYRKRLGNNG